MRVTRLSAGCPALVATLPPQGSPRSATFSMARSVTFSMAIDTRSERPCGRVYPRARGGAKGIGSEATQSYGSIPAHAGEPSLTACEHAAMLARGLSPRTRGSLSRAHASL